MKIWVNWVHFVNGLSRPQSTPPELPLFYIFHVRKMPMISLSFTHRVKERDNKAFFGIGKCKKGAILGGTFGVIWPDGILGWFTTSFRILFWYSSAFIAIFGYLNEFQTTFGPILENYEPAFERVLDNLIYRFYGSKK